MRAATKCGFSAWWHWLTCSRTILRVHVWCDKGISQENEGEARSSAQQQEANQVGSSIGFGENAMHTHARARACNATAEARPIRTTDQQLLSQCLRLRLRLRLHLWLHLRTCTESMSASASVAASASVRVCASG
jgi:hypothetical protein